MFGSKLNILKKEWIDVVFAGRNKTYGAYALRQGNPRTTNRALLFGVAFFVIIISAKTIMNIINGFIPAAPVKVKITQVVLLPPPPVNPAKRPPPPPPEPPRPRVTQVKFPPPIVKPDNEVKENPPTQKELETKDPGQANIKGNPDADINIDGPVGTSDNKVTEADPNTIFTAVEVEPNYPNFNAYLSKNIQYPAVDREDNVQGRVIVNFVVEKDGTISDIKVLRSPDQAMSDEAIRVLKACPPWRPGIQNGRPVRCYFTVPINFTLNSDD